MSVAEAIISGDEIVPHSVESEQYVLGAALLSPDAAAEVAEALRPEDYYRPAHQMIHEAIVAMFNAGMPVEPALLFEELLTKGTLLRVGGGPYLHSLVASVKTASNVGYYLKIVKEKAALRRLLEVGDRIASHRDGATDADTAIRRAQEDLMGLADAYVGEDYLTLNEAMPGVLDELEALGQGRSGVVKTGFKDLDALLLGLHPGQLVVVGARPSVGKSTLGLDVARNAAKNHLPAVVFSLEMGRSDIVTRFLSAEARVSLHKIRAGMMDDEEWARVAKRIGEIGNIPLFIDDSPNLSMMDIRAKCRRLKQRHNLGLVVVDYLQLMDHGGARTDSRQQEVSEISRSLKLLAKELEIPIIAMSQLNRGPEQRTDKRPVPSDLRESGSIEQDADVILLLHREDIYDKESPRAGEADLIVAKNRNGPTATVVVAFQGHYSRFVDMAH